MDEYTTVRQAVASTCHVSSPSNSFAIFQNHDNVHISTCGKFNVIFIIFLAGCSGVASSTATVHTSLRLAGVKIMNLCLPLG
jgi:hypothetical protein